MQVSSYNPQIKEKGFFLSRIVNVLKLLLLSNLPVGQMAPEEHSDQASLWCRVWLGAVWVGPLRARPQLCGSAPPREKDQEGDISYTSERTHQCNNKELRHTAHWVFFLEALLKSNFNHEL